MTVMSLDDDAKMVCPSCKVRQTESAKYYVVLNEFGTKSLCKERCGSCIEEFKAWRDVEGVVQVDIIKELVPNEPITLTERLMALFDKVRWYQYTIGVVVALILILQPWEDPKKKVADEWVACNTKYADKCTYAGTVFRTGEFEMAVAELLYGNISDKRLYKLRYPNGR